MQFDRGYISPYFVTDAEKMRAELEDAYVLSMKRSCRACSPAAFARTVAAVGQAAADHCRGHEGEALAPLVVNKLRGGPEDPRR